MRAFYLFLCILGTAWPIYNFFPWIAENGFSLSLMFRSILDSPLLAFAWSDLVVSSIALLGFMFAERRQKPPAFHYWLPIAALIIIGLSLALPLFLYLRETRLKNSNI